MSASLKSGMPGNRDAFAAYLCDETALDVLRPVVIELGWPPEKCNKGGLRNAIQSLSVSASPNILMVDLSESGDPLNDINALAEVCEPGTVVIAIGQVNDVRLYRDLLASGIHDYLLKPLSANALRDALTQAQAVFMAPRGGEEEGVKHHVSTAVIGTRGGVGASTLVTSLAWVFSTEKRMPTALLDLDVHFGTGALTLDLEPGRGLTDAIDNPSRIDGLFIERAMIRAERQSGYPVGRSAGQPAADDRWRGIHAVAGRIQAPVRDDGARHAAQHDDQFPAIAHGCERHRAGGGNVACLGA